MNYASRHRFNESLGAVDADNNRDSELDFEVGQQQSDTDEIHALQETLNHERAERYELEERLARAIDTLDEVIEQKDEAERRLDNTIETLEQVIERNDEAEQRLTHITENLEQTIQERDEIECENRAANEELAKANATIGEYETKIQQQEKTAESFRQVLEDKEQTLTQLKAELGNFKEKVTRMEGALETKEEELVTARQECTEQAGYSESLREAEQKIESLMVTNSKIEFNLRAQLKKAEQEYLHLQQVNKGLKEQGVRDNEEISSLRVKQDHTMFLYEEAQKELDLCREDFKAQQAKFDKEILAMETRIKQMQNRLSETLESELASKDARILSLEVKIEGLTSETEATVRVLCEQIEDLEGRLSRASQKDAEALGQQKKEMVAELSRRQTESDKELARKDALLKDHQREVESLTEALMGPEATVICVDCSGSMHGTGMATAIKDLGELLSAIKRRNPGAYVGILGHNSHLGVSTLHDLSNIKSAMECCLAGIEPNGCEKWMDAIETARGMLRRHEGEKSKMACRIICLGDGGTEWDWEPIFPGKPRLDLLFSRLRRDGIVVHTVVHDQTRGELAKVSQATGGKSLTASVSGSLGAEELIGTGRYKIRRGGWEWKSSMEKA